MLTWNFRLEVRLPRTWLSLVDEIAWNYEEETVDSVMQKTIQLVAKAAACASTFASDKDAVFKLEASLLDTLEFPDNGIGPDLLSPIPSRNPSPRRIRPKSKSPARWKILRSINDAIQDVLDSRTPGVHGASRYHVLLIMMMEHTSALSQGSPSRSSRPTSRLQPFPHHRYAEVSGRGCEQSIRHW